MTEELLETELTNINKAIAELASMNGMTVDYLEENLDKVSIEIAYTMLPILKQKLRYLKALWSIQVQKEGLSNVVLFTRTGAY